MSHLLHGIIYLVLFLGCCEYTPDAEQVMISRPHLKGGVVAVSYVPFLLWHGPLGLPVASI